MVLVRFSSVIRNTTVPSSCCSGIVADTVTVLPFIVGVTTVSNNTPVALVGLKPFRSNVRVTTLPGCT